MGKLVLKFDDRILKEVPIGTAPIKIGRAPDNDLQIDNLAVSNYHARVYFEGERLLVEDLDSLNGTFINHNRVKREWLTSGDSILVGKHVILVDQAHDVAIFATTRKVTAPKVDETVILDSKKRPDLQQGATGTRESSRSRVPTLIVVGGKADRKEYHLSGKLTVIGKSPLATVRLKGWFVPQVVAQIGQRQDGYYLMRTAKRVPKVNGQPVESSTKLNDGDAIQLGRVSLKFVFQD